MRPRWTPADGADPRTGRGAVLPYPARPHELHTGLTCDVAHIKLPEFRLCRIGHADQGGWDAGAAPEGSADNLNSWVRTQLGFDEGAIVTTRDTVYAGFGFEGLAPAQRNELIARSMKHLLR